MSGVIVDVGLLLMGLFRMSSREVLWTIKLMIYSPLASNLVDYDITCKLLHATYTLV